MSLQDINLGDLKKIEKLIKQKQSLFAQIDDINSQLDAMVGGSAPKKSTYKKKRGRPAKKKATTAPKNKAGAKKKAVRKRKPGLGPDILKALKGGPKEGLTVGDIAGVTKRPTNSVNTTNKATSTGICNRMLIKPLRASKGLNPFSL